MLSVPSLMIDECIHEMVSWPRCTRNTAQLHVFACSICRNLVKWHHVTSNDIIWQQNNQPRKSLKERVHISKKNWCLRIKVTWSSSDVTQMFINSTGQVTIGEAGEASSKSPLASRLAWMPQSSNGVTTLKLTARPWRLKVGSHASGAMLV